jgi:hypothetical protein
MANHGKNSRTYINGNDLSTMLKSFSVSETVDVVEASGFNSESKSYVVGLQDATISSEGFFAGSTYQTDNVFNSVLGTTAIWTFYPNRSGVGQPGYGIRTDEVSYEIMSPIDGVVSVTVEGQATLGADRILSHVASNIRSTSGFATAVDAGTTSLNGGIGYLQVLTISANTTVSVHIQHSSAGTLWANVGTFATKSSVGAERLPITGTIKRYTRAEWAFNFVGAHTATINVGFKRK